MGATHGFWTHSTPANTIRLCFAVNRRSGSRSGKLSKSVYTLSATDKVNIAQDPALSALVHWIRSAGQQNVDSLVKVGDSYCESRSLSFDVTSR